MSAQVLAQVASQVPRQLTQVPRHVSQQVAQVSSHVPAQLTSPVWTPPVRPGSQVARPQVWQVAGWVTQPTPSQVTQVPRPQVTQVPWRQVAHVASPHLVAAVGSGPKTPPVVPARPLQRSKSDSPKWCVTPGQRASQVSGKRGRTMSSRACRSQGSDPPGVPLLTQSTDAPGMRLTRVAPGRGTAADPGGRPRLPPRPRCGTPRSSPVPWSGTAVGYPLARCHRAGRPARSVRRRRLPCWSARRDPQGGSSSRSVLPWTSPQKQRQVLQWVCAKVGQRRRVSHTRRCRSLGRC